MLDPHVITAAVKAQYEEHPYLAWESLPDVEINDNEQSVLFAGCGTGRDVLYDAKSAPRSNFLEIDLSGTSLDFARRKAVEFGIANVRFAQLNLLDVDNLGERFDFIKSTGVLHHMADPLSGLMALKGVLTSMDKLSSRSTQRSQDAERWLQLRFARK